MSIIVGSVDVEIVPSTRTFSTKLKAALQPIADKIGLQIGETIGDRISDAMPKAGEKAGGFFGESFKKRVALALKNLPDASVKLDDVKAQAKLDALRAKLELLGTKRIGIDIDAGKAEAELLALKAETDALAGSSGSGGGFSGLANSIGEASSGFSLLIPAVILFGSTLIPIIAVVTAGLGGIVAVLAAATAGFGVFAAFAIPAVQGALKGQTALDAAKLQYQNATTSKQRAAALLKEKQATENLSGSQLQFLSVLNQVKGAYNAVAKAAAPAILGAISAVLKAAVPLIQSLTPLLNAVTPVIAGLGASLAATFAGPGFHAFIAFLSQEAPIAMAGLLTIALNVGKIVANMVVAFAPLGNLILSSLGGALASLAKDTANLGSNAGFQSFLAYVVAVAPVVGKFFLELVKAAIALGVAFAPLGLLMLQTLTPILAFTAAHPELVIFSLAAAFIAVGVALIFISDSNPIGLILTGIVLVAVGLIELVALIVKNFTAIKDFLVKWAALILLPLYAFIAIPLLIWQHWSLISGYVETALSTAYTAVKSWFSKIVAAVTGAVSTAYNAAVGFFQRLPGQILSAITTGFPIVVAFFAALPGRLAYALGFWIGLQARIFLDAMKAAYQAIITAVPAIIGFFEALPGRIVTAIINLDVFLFNAGIAGITGLYNGIVTAFGAVVTFVTQIPGKVVSGLTTLGSTLLTTGSGAMGQMLSGFTTGLVSIVNFFTGIPEAIFNVVGDLPGQFLQLGKNVINQFVSGIESAAKGVGGGVLGLAEKAVSGVKKGLGGNATGGLITGPGTSTSDSILRRLSNGEYVVNAAATAKNLGLLQAINAGQSPRLPTLTSTNAASAASVGGRGGPLIGQAVIREYLDPQRVLAQLQFLATSS